MIEVSGLKKTFGDVVAIEDVSFLTQPCSKAAILFGRVKKKGTSSALGPGARWQFSYPAAVQKGSELSCTKRCTGENR